MMLAEVYEKKADNMAAIEWYKRAVPLIKNIEMKTELQKRIDDLKK